MDDFHHNRYFKDIDYNTDPTFHWGAQAPTAPPVGGLSGALAAAAAAAHGDSGVGAISEGGAIGLAAAAYRAS